MSQKFQSAFFPPRISFFYLTILNGVCQDGPSKGGKFCSLKKLKDGLLTLDWRKHQRAQAQVRIAIEDLLDELLPDTFTTDLYETKCELVYRHIYENYFGDGRSTYASMPLVV